MSNDNNQNVQNTVDLSNGSTGTPVNNTQQVNNAHYPQSGMPYPRSGMPYPQSGMPYPQSGMPYPQSGMPYPQSGMPYPQSGMPYPNSAQIKKKKMSNTTFAVLAAVVVLVFAAIAIVLVLLFGKADNNDDDLSDSSSNSVVSSDEIVQIEKEEDYSKGLPKQEDYVGYNVTPKLLIDGKSVYMAKGMMNIDNSNMASVGELALLFGFDVTADLKSRTYTLSYGGESFVFTHGKATCTRHKEDGTKSTIGITKAPIVFSNGEMYVSVSGVKTVFGFKEIKWDDTANCVSITTNGEITLIN